MASESNRLQSGFLFTSYLSNPFAEQLTGHCPNEIIIIIISLTEK
jgi:hypothetical protein